MEDDMTFAKHAARIAELRAIIASYHAMTVEEAEQTDAGDREFEARTELWRLEQEMLESRKRDLKPPRAA
jgi:hypothetical protein